MVSVNQPRVVYNANVTAGTSPATAEPAENGYDVFALSGACHRDTRGCPTAKSEA